MNHGLPGEHGIENIRINKAVRNTWVVIDCLSPSDVQTIFNSINYHETKQKFFDAPLYCKALRNMTPVKKTPEQVENPNNTKEDILKEPTEPEKKDDEKPKIPGLPETERLKKKKEKKKKKGNDEKEEVASSTLSRNEFLLSPNSGLLKKDVTQDFEFSDYESDDSEEAFEDSKESFSDDNEETVASMDFLTPANPKSTFARTLYAKSNAKSATKAGKRAANSPAEYKEKKKTRAQSESRIPKKK